MMIKTLDQINREFFGEEIDETEETADTEDIEDTEVREDTEETEEIVDIVEVEKTSEINYKAGRHAAQVYRKTSLWKDIAILLTKFIIIALVFALAFTFLFGILQHRDSSMDPAIYDGDLIIFFRYTKNEYLPRDTIVLEIDGQKQVRRVIAMSGDTVEITESGLKINGALQQEMGIYFDTQRYEDGIEFPVVVPEGHVFVLGDNRLESTDSRIYGCVSFDNILGNVIAVIRQRII